jgi:comEA protein
MIERFKKFGFTGQDLIIISFLLITFVSGIVIKITGWKQTQNFDYSNADSKFEMQLKDGFAELERNNLSSSETKKLELLEYLSDSLTARKDRQENEDLLAKFERKININLAFSADLQRLPGIGKVMADRIIEYREQNSRFEKIEDIMKVRGIGAKKFEKIKELITTED